MLRCVVNSCLFSPSLFRCSDRLSWSDRQLWQLWIFNGFPYFLPKSSAFEVRPRGLLHSISITSECLWSVVLAEGICSPPFSFFQPSSSSLSLHLQYWAPVTDDVKRQKTAGNCLVEENPPGLKEQCIQARMKTMDSTVSFTKWSQNNWCLFSGAFEVIPGFVGLMDWLNAMDFSEHF